MILGIDRADRLTGIVAAAGRPTVIGTAVASGGVGHDRIIGGETLAQTAHRIGFRDWFHRESLLARRTGVVGARNAHDLLSLLIERLQIVITERPVDTDVVEALDFEVIGHITPGVSRPVPCRAAHLPYIFGGVGIRPGLHEIVVRLRLVDRVRRPFGGRIGRHPVATTLGIPETRHQSAARDARAGFQDDDRRAGQCELARH